MKTSAATARWPRVGCSVLVATQVLVGCESVPSAQLVAFADSLAAVRQAEQPIFADLALAEERGADNRADPCPDQPPLMVPGAAPIRNGFCVLEIAAVAGIAEPPDTAAYKAGMEALQIYTGTLTTLAAAESAADTSAQLQSAAGNLSGIAQALRIGVGGFAAGIIGPIGALAPLIDQAAAQFSKDEARRLILTGSEQVRAIIAAERAAVPAIWNIITSDWRDELTLISPKDFQGAARLRARIETYRDHPVGLCDHARAARHGMDEDRGGDDEPAARHVAGSGSADRTAQDQFRSARPRLCVAEGWAGINTKGAAMIPLAEARGIVTSAIGKISAQRTDPAITPEQLASLDAALQRLLPTLHAIERMQLDQGANAVDAAATALRAVTATKTLDTIGQIKQEISTLLRRLDDAQSTAASTRPSAEASNATDHVATAAVSPTGAALVNSTRFEDLREEYLRLFETCAPAPGKEALVRGELSRLLAGRARYEAVAADVPGMPWYLVGIIHGMEAGYRFDRHQHNGDPLTARTMNVPAGRPSSGGPPFTWEESARDALALGGLNKQVDFSIAQLLYRFEKYNGFGYRSRGVPSPYLWGGSIHYRSGKFVADHQFSDTAVSAQIGAAVLVKELTRPNLPPLA